MSEPHLKPHLYYSDLYDRGTVEMCRRTEQSFDKDDAPLPKVKGVGKKEAMRVKTVAKEWYLHFETGERYLNKDTTIREWMDRDEKLDQLLESAQAPEGIRCLACRNLVKPTFKTLFYATEKPERVLFMYDCPNNCAPRRAFFSDGEEWRVKPDLCPQCNTALDKKIDDDGTKMMTTYTCGKCGYTNTDELVWTHKKDEGIDLDFAKDRDRFCLTEEQGQKYYSEKINLEQLGKIMERIKEEDKAREEKLKANPNGFILEGVGRNCAICSNGSQEDGSWYDKYGIKCLVCQKAIDEGEIPASLAKDDDNRYSKWELESYFNIKAPTLRKWIKDGIIKVRTISRYGQGVHAELFLLEDNKGFLPPKKLLKGRSVKMQKDGKDWYTSQKWYQFQDPFKLLKGYKIMDYMRVVPPEEMKAREEEEKRKWEAKRARREQVKKVRDAKKRRGNRTRFLLRLGGMKFELPKKLNIRAFLVFAAVAVAAFLALGYFRDSLPKITEVILVIELGLLITITWGLAAHAVLKSLFAVSVELSLILFLADEYCKTPPLAHTADNALMTLVGVGMIYIGFKFFWSIYEEAVARSKSLKEAYDHKWPWTVIIPFALFTGLFAWQIIQVLTPIVQNLCVYHP